MCHFLYLEVFPDIFLYLQFYSSFENRWNVFITSIDEIAWLRIITRCTAVLFCATLLHNWIINSFGRQWNKMFDVETSS